jgi:hypothetical protein
MKLFQAISDRILKLFLSDVTAGACTADYGCCCGTPSAPMYVACNGTCRYGGCTECSM